MKSIAGWGKEYNGAVKDRYKVTILYKAKGGPETAHTRKCF